MVLPDVDRAAEERQRARQFAWLDKRHAELVAELLAELPAILAARPVVRESVEDDAALTVAGEFLDRCLGDPGFVRSVMGDS